MKHKKHSYAVSWLHTMEWNLLFHIINMSILQFIIMAKDNMKATNINNNTELKL